jgi:hypothetical protein
MELTPTQKEILARLRALNAAQTVALGKKVTSYAEFQEIEKNEEEIIALHRELIESVRLTQMQDEIISTSRASGCVNEFGGTPYLGT